MAIVHLQSGIFEPGAETENSATTPAFLMRRALLVYEGEFESMDGVVNVGRDELTTLATNHNGQIESASRLAEGKESMKDFPPVQLDHSTSAKDTVGRLIGKLELGQHKTRDGREVMAAYGNVKILGEENVAKVIDGRWTHLSVGVDFEKGKFSELTITPFPAAPEASLLKNRLGAQDAIVKQTKNYDVYEFIPGRFEIYNKKKKEFEDGHWTSVQEAERWAKRILELSSKDTEMSKSSLAQYRYRISYKDDKIIKVVDAIDEEQAEQKVLDYAAEAFDLKNYSDINQVKIKKMGNKLMSKNWKSVRPSEIEFFNHSEAYYLQVNHFVDVYAGVALNIDTEKWDWVVIERGSLLGSGNTTQLNSAKLAVEKCLKSNGVRLSEGDKSMDKEKMKKHLMEKEEMSEKDAEEKLAKCTEEELKKLAVEIEVDEDEEESEEKKEMASAEKEEKKEMAEEKKDEKEEMSQEKTEEKKSLKEEEKPEEKKMAEDQEKRMASARDRIVKLSSDFRKAFEGSQLAAKKGKIISRLSALRSGAKITPAEIKKIDIERLASQGDETVDLVLKTYEDREPVVMTGALGSIKAGDLANLSKEIRMSRLEQETRQNMSLLKKTVKTRLQGEKESGEVSVHIDTTPHVDQEIEMAYGEVCKMMDEGKLKEAKEMLKKYMVKSQSEGKMDMVEHDKQLSALAEESIKMQNKFDELQKLAVSLVG